MREKKSIFTSLRQNDSLELTNKICQMFFLGALRIKNKTELRKLSRQDEFNNFSSTVLLRILFRNLINKFDLLFQPHK